MKINYDPEVDALSIILSNRPVVESDENRPGVILDYDANGNIVGLEILDASKHAELPNSCEFAVAS
jgi:uncharacterized protein YuzE